MRFFLTFPYGRLPDDLQAFARSMLPNGSEPWPGMRCLTLLGTAGDRPEWNARSASAGHKAIPFHSAKFIGAFPMLSNLIRQFGISIDNVINPSLAFFLEQGGRSFNVFHVPDAQNSPLVPAQESFVLPFAIRSVLGFGGPLPSGDIYIMVLFSRVSISADTAALFKTLSLSLKLATIPFERRVFSAGLPEDRPPELSPDEECPLLRAIVANLEDLLAVHERVVAEQSARLRVEGECLVAANATLQAKTAELEQTNSLLKNEIAHRERVEGELLVAHRLESVGQLAAGIAHEINTPTQYVGDNTRFLQGTFAQLCTLCGHYDALLDAARQGAAVPAALVTRVEDARRQVDWDYLRDEIPQAFQQSMEGIERVAKIVGAMKDFSHMGTGEKALTDLNKAIETTITVAHNEWKYVAEVVTEFDPDLPPVLCRAHEFNQVVLNLLVNAAHAIGDVVHGGGDGKGVITVRTSRDGDWAEVRVGDTGTGIPEAIRHRIFDPFFTTKAVGRGTGQGLAIARSIVVDKHGGTITFETEIGKGTTFIVRLPIGGNAVAEAERQP